MPLTYIETTGRIILATLLGGIIGMERETTNRPAGFRTHILVCLGSTVIMLTSIFIFTQFEGRTNLDPGRIPAQVISGIGFIGAGTIIIEGSTVKGLTTATTLWTVAIIGLSVGVGFYYVAVIATITILLTLTFLGKLEETFLNKNHVKSLMMIIEDIPGQLGRIGSTLGDMDVQIKDIQMESMENGKLSLVLRIQKKSDYDMSDIMERLLKVTGVYCINNKQDNSLQC